MKLTEEEKQLLIHAKDETNWYKICDDIVLHFIMHMKYYTISYYRRCLTSSWRLNCVGTRICL